MTGTIEARYETRRPSAQTIADIFRGAWKSQLPGGLISGSAEMFSDPRPAWLNARIPGGLRFKSILEVGPFEGYQTYLLEHLGARDIVSVEGNSLNYLKCLCLKEILGLRASLRFGDIMEELASTRNHYDVLWASGVLYHMADPIKFIELSSNVADHIFVWTHVYDESNIKSLTDDAQAHFVSQLDSKVQFENRSIIYHAHTYGLQNYANSIPLHWEGAPQDITNWITQDDMFYIFEAFGFRIVDTEKDFLGGMPVISFLASRK